MIAPSRRDVLRLSTMATAGLGMQRILAQARSAGDFRPSLVQEFPRSATKALSPDGSMLCLEEWSDRGYPLRVVEVGTWRTLYVGHFSSRVRGLPSFFSDSENLLVSTFASNNKGVCGAGKGHCAGMETTVGIRSGRQVEAVLPFVQNEYDSLYAIMGSTILDIHRTDQTDSLALLEFPSFKQITKVPYAIQPRQPRPVISGIKLSTDYGLSISDNRQKLAYAFDETVLCRRTTDLAVVWQQSVEHGMKPLRVALSPSGNRVAVAVADGEPVLNQAHRSYIIIYDGENGEDLKRLMLNWAHGIALSADGSLLALDLPRPGKNGEVIITVHLYDASSGDELGSVVHDHIKKGRHQFLEAGCGIAFTSNGNFMITSGMTTKVWRIAD